MNKDTLINWFESRRGLLTYSMLGSRNGSDGTADCSGGVSQALKEAGVDIQGLPSTVTLGQQLANNGFVRISKNQDWEAKRGDIVLMSWGADMSSSGGAGGHVGAMEDTNMFISVDFYTGGQTGTAVSSHQWNDYYNTNKPAYIEVWRYAGKETKTVAFKKPLDKAFYKADDVKLVNDIYQIKCNYLVPIGFDWTENGIPIAMINWCDKNGKNITDGKDKDFKKGMYFSFIGDEAHIRDTGDGGYYGGYYYRQFEFGQYGPVWLSAWSKDDLVNYYK